MRPVWPALSSLWWRTLTRQADFLHSLLQSFYHAGLSLFPDEVFQRLLLTRLRAMQVHNLIVCTLCSCYPVGALCASFILSLKYPVCRLLTLLLVLQISVLGASPPWYKSRSAAQQNLARHMAPCSASSCIDAQFHMLQLQCDFCSAACLQSCLLASYHQLLEAVTMPTTCCLQELLCLVQALCQTWGPMIHYHACFMTVVTVLCAYCQSKTFACCVQKLSCPRH